MKHGISLLFLIVIVLSAFIFISQCSAPQQDKQTQSQHQSFQKEDTPELAEYMGTLQYYTHKFALAIDAQNLELATFYFNEIRALTEVIKKDIPGYEGYDIARFIKLFLDPAIETMAAALTEKPHDWQKKRANVEEMINSCNSCHNATSHGFVQVTPGFENNSYNQDFSGKK